MTESPKTKSVFADQLISNNGDYYVDRKMESSPNLVEYDAGPRRIALPCHGGSANSPTHRDSQEEIVNGMKSRPNKRSA